MATLHELLLFAVLASLLTRETGGESTLCASSMIAGYCPSWRVAVEANNIRHWRTVPAQCLLYVGDYMLGGQYERDLNMVLQQIFGYMAEIHEGAEDGRDAWVLDADDTCLSNILYYEGRRFGGDPFDPMGFKSWAEMALCPAIPAVLGLHRRLVEAGFKVFIISGRDEEHLGTSTAENLGMVGFHGYERLIMRGASYRGQSAVVFKSAIRKQLVEQGYRIRGNVGDQWSDILGECVGDRTFKLPNPMYCVP